MSRLLLKTPTLLRRLAVPQRTYSAVVVRVTDGDTLMVTVPEWSDTPFEKIALRIAGIDTPESSKSHAKCAKELKLGLAASAFAKTLTKTGNAISFQYLGHDKYMRLDANVTVAAGDWGEIMLSKGYAVPYTGGTKKNWCKAG